MAGKAKKKKETQYKQPEIADTMADAIQNKAVTFGDGPLLIVAGAGTGKTRVITERIAWLINSGKTGAANILALTFSEKAAKEMEERVDRLVPYGMIETQISTFHSFGRRIINENFAELRIAPDWDILKDTDAIVMIVENIDRFDLDIYKPLNNPALYVSALTGFISKLKDNLIQPEDYAGFVMELEKTSASDEELEVLDRHRELARFYATYEKIKTEKNRMDFGDLILVPFRLFKEKKSVLKKYRERFKYILIDEFQDTNYAQFEFIKLLAGDNGNINVVGDDDQMIYKFRGAAISNILGFRDSFRDAEVVVLKNNYRTCQAILDAAHKLIQNNTDRLETRLKIDKHLVSKYVSGSKAVPLNVRVFENYSEEADFCAETIIESVNKGKYKFSDFAVLVRARNDAKIFLKTFEKKGIPFTFTGDEGLYNKKEVQFLINFCRTLAAPYEFNPILDVAISEYYRIDAFVMSKAGNLAKEHSISVFDMLKSIDKYPELMINDTESDKIRMLVKDIEEYTSKVSEKWSPGEILYDFVKTRKIFEELLKDGTPEADTKAANISAFFEILKRFSVNQEYDTIHNFVNYIDLSIKSGENPKDDNFFGGNENAVQVLTIHKSKGLEFRVVFVAALIQEKFPGRKRADYALPLPETLMKDIVDEDTYFHEEERRLFYVAITRAKDVLYLTAARQYEGAPGKKISVFLKELGYETPEEFTVTPDRVKKFEYFERKKTALELAKKEARPGMLKLSNYQIDDYLTCPFKYKIVHVLKMPMQDKPNVMIGSAMHAMASEFFKARQEGVEKTAAELRAIFDSMWKPKGFLTQAEAQKNYEGAIKSIENFHRTESLNTNVPLYLEKDFEFKLTPELSVRGRWDRIDEVDGKIMIVDYKTSDVRTEEKAQDKIKTQDIQRQLKLYCLAYDKMFGRLPDSAGIYFFKNSMMVTKQFREKSIREYEEKIFEVAEHIKNEEFDATPGIFVCRYCAFYNICPYSKADVLF
jgi:DNA helicase-2/ATP-dependent DNA helicase PcrA